MTSIQRIFEVAVPEGRTRVTVSAEGADPAAAEREIEDFRRALTGADAAGNPGTTPGGKPPR